MIAPRPTPTGRRSACKNGSSRSSRTGLEFIEGSSRPAARRNSARERRAEPTRRRRTAKRVRLSAALQLGTNCVECSRASAEQATADARELAEARLKIFELEMERRRRAAGAARARFRRASSRRPCRADSRLPRPPPTAGDEPPQISVVRRTRSMRRALPPRAVAASRTSSGRRCGVAAAGGGRGIYLHDRGLLTKALTRGSCLEPGAATNALARAREREKLANRVPRLLSLAAR